MVNPRTLASAAAGIVVGLAVAAVVARYRAEPAPLRTAAAIAVTPTWEAPPPTARGLDDSTRNEAVPVVAQPNPAPSSPRQGDGVDPMPAFQSALRDHEHARRTAWARNAEADLTSDLETAGRLVRAEVRRVDCRTSTCTAELRFENHAAAAAGFPLILQSNHHQACTSEIVLDPIGDRDPTAPYDVTALFRCEREVP